MTNTILKTRSARVEPNENGFHWITKDAVIEATISDTRIMTQIRKLAKINPDVVIDQEPSKDNNGFMLALIPFECLKLGKKKHLTEEQKQRFKERVSKR